MATSFSWTDIAYGGATDPAPINRMGKQVADLSNRGCQAAWSFTASSAVGTSATGILTISSAILESGKAYSVENVGGVYGDVDGRRADFQLWTPNTSGSLIGAFYRTYAGGPGAQMNCYGKIYLRRTANSNFIGDVVLAATANAGNITHDAAAGRPRACIITELGPASAYPFAFDVP
jgi:hypothetical protein